MAGTPSVSVVMPLLNGMPLLTEQLDALGRQDWDGPWEFVVADNGCTDASIAAARAAEGSIPSVVIADATRRRGISHARNAGVAAASGTHVMFCDADDAVDPSWISAAVTAFETADFIGGHLRLDRLNHPADLVSRTPPTDGALPIAFGRVRYAVGANFGLLREAYLAVGGCDERFRICGDDVDLSWRLGEKGTPPTWAPEVIVDYRFRSGIRNLYRQQRNYGEAQTLLEKVHGPQAPLLERAGSSAREWLTLVSHPQMLVRGPQARGDYVRAAAMRVGRVRGSLRNKVFSP